MLTLFTIPHKLYKPYFDAISLYKKEVEFNVRENDVYISTFDSGRNRMISSTLKVKPTNVSTFKVSLEPLLKISPGDDVEFYSSDGRIHIRAGPMGAWHHLRTIDTRLDIASTAELPMKWSPLATLIMEEAVAKSLYESVKLANSCDVQTITFAVKDKVLSFTTKASEEHTIEMPCIEGVEGDDCTSMFSTLYIEMALKYYKDFTSITFLMNHEAPCKFIMKSEFIDTDIYVSPRMD